MSIASGVATSLSKSMKPSPILATRSSAPTTSAPASVASVSFSPLATTATRTSLPVPPGRFTVERICWSFILGLIPSLKCTSTVGSNLTVFSSLRTLNASSAVKGFGYFSLIAFKVFWRLVSLAMIRVPYCVLLYFCDYSWTVMPMLRAVPLTIASAASMVVALRSGILILAISVIFSLETEPTLVLFG